MNLSNKTKTELTAMARRKKIPVTSGMLKDELIKTIKKGLRKIEAQKKSKTAKKTSKKKSSKAPKGKTARKTKTAKRKTATAKRKQTPVKKKAARKKSPVKAKTRKTPAKKSAARKPQKARTPKTVQSPTLSKSVEIPSELPERYGDHRLVVLARDPNWAYAFWDLNTTQVQDLLKRTGQSSTSARWVLRVYSSALHPEEDKGHYFDIDINVKTGSYYLDLSRPGARFTVEIGVIDTSGMFRATAQSNPIILPLDHPSETIAPEGTAPSETPASPDGPGFNKPPSSQSE